MHPCIRYPVDPYQQKMVVYSVIACCNVLYIGIQGIIDPAEPFPEAFQYKIFRFFTFFQCNTGNVHGDTSRVLCIFYHALHIKKEPSPGLSLTFLELLDLRFDIIDHFDETVDIVYVSLLGIDGVEDVHEKVQALFQVRYL